MATGQYCYKYPHPAVTTDNVIFGYDGTRLRVLLVERGGEPYKGYWALPGGFLNPDEEAGQGALRELREETGLEPAHVEQLHAYSTPGRDPREWVISVAYMALVRPREVKGSDDAADARWFPLDEVPQLAFDHADMLRDALKRLRERARFYPIGLGLMPATFTIAELQSLYEAIIGRRLDSGLFARKMQARGLLSPLDEAGHYTFNIDRYNELLESGFLTEE